MPKVSVLLPLFNAEKYILESLESILIQSFADFEVLILNDGSTDRGVAFIEKYLKESRENRVRILNNEKNLGISETLNNGLREAKGTYVARMDADDLSFPERFEAQVKFLDAHPEIDLLGTGYTTFGLGASRTQFHPEKNDQIQWALLFDSAFAHPTIMARRESLLRNSLFYDQEYNGAEDYELWTRCALKIKLHNLQLPLLHYRLHAQQVSAAKREHQIQHGERARVNYLNALGISLSKEALAIHHQVSREELIHTSESFLVQLKNWKNELEAQITSKYPARLEAFKTELKRRFTIYYYVFYKNQELKKFILAENLFAPRTMGFRKKFFFILRAFSKR